MTALLIPVIAAWAVVAFAMGGGLAYFRHQRRLRRPDYAEIARLEQELGFAPKPEPKDTNLTQVVRSPYSRVILPGDPPTRLLHAQNLAQMQQERLGPLPKAFETAADAVPYFLAWSASHSASAYYAPPPPPKAKIYGPDGKLLDAPHHRHRP